MNKNPPLPPSFPDFLCYYNQQVSIKRKDSSNPSSSRKLHNQQQKQKQPKKKKKVQSPLVRKASACAPSERPISLFTLIPLSLSLSFCVHISVVMLF
jgi:hypothetical protein